MYAFGKQWGGPWEDPEDVEEKRSQQILGNGLWRRARSIKLIGEMQKRNMVFPVKTKNVEIWIRNFEVYIHLNILRPIKGV